MLFIGCIAIQVKQQLLDTEQDYDQLKSTPFVTSLGITLEDLKWATDMSTSRSFVIPKGLGGTKWQRHVCLLWFQQDLYCTHDI